MANRTIGRLSRALIKESVEGATGGFALWRTGPAVLGHALKFFVQMVKPNRAGDQKPVETKRPFGKRHRPDKRIHDIKPARIIANELRRERRKEEQSERGECA